MLCLGILSWIQIIQTDSQWTQINYGIKEENNPSQPLPWWDFSGPKQMNDLVQDWPKWPFRMKFFCPSKVPEFLHVLFNVVEKTFSTCIFFWLKCSCSALLHSLCTLRYFVFIFLTNKVQSSQKNTGECFTTKLKSTCKNSGTFEGKKIHLKKSLRSVLHKPFIWCLVVH